MLWDSLPGDLPPDPDMWIDHEVEIGAPNAEACGAGVDSGDHGVADMIYSNMDVDDANAAGGGECDRGGGDNGLPDMLVDGGEESAFPSFVLSSPYPVAGASWMLEVEEVSRLFHQQEGRASDRPKPLVRYTTIYSAYDGYVRYAREPS